LEVHRQKAENGERELYVALSFAYGLHTGYHGYQTKRRKWTPNRKSHPIHNGKSAYIHAKKRYTPLCVDIYGFEGGELKIEERKINDVDEWISIDTDRLLTVLGTSFTTATMTKQ